MIESVPKIMNIPNILGISKAYLVIKPSRKPAAMVNGIVLRNIFKLSLKPIFNEFNRE